MSNIMDRIHSNQPIVFADQALTVTHTSKGLIIDGKTLHHESTTMWFHALSYKGFKDGILKDSYMVMMSLSTAIQLLYSEVIDLASFESATRHQNGHLINFKYRFGELKLNLKAYILKDEVYLQKFKKNPLLIIADEHGCIIREVLIDELLANAKKKKVEGSSTMLGQLLRESSVVSSDPSHYAIALTNLTLAALHASGDLKPLNEPVASDNIDAGITYIQNGLVNFVEGQSVPVEMWLMDTFVFEKKYGQNALVVVVEKATEQVIFSTKYPLDN